MVSCDSFLGGAEAYGTPHVKFTVKGNVTDEGKNPVKGIRVEFYAGDKPSNYDPNTITGDKGEYIITDPYMWPPNNDGTTITVVATDIDGEENGRFETTSKSVVIYQSDFKGGSGSWDDGEATKIVDLVLLKYAPEDNEDHAPEDNEDHGTDENEEGGETEE